MASGPTLRPFSGASLSVLQPARALTSTGAIVAATDVNFGDLVTIPFFPDVVRNIFEASRPGRPVFRANDLLALRIELRNLAINPAAEGKPPTLVKSGSGSALLILHFPPQAITEETFFEAAPPDIGDPDDIPGEKPPHPEKQDKPEPAGGGSETLRKPPVRARIADEFSAGLQGAGRRGDPLHAGRHPRRLPTTGTGGGVLGPTAGLAGNFHRHRRPIQGVGHKQAVGAIAHCAGASRGRQPQNCRARRRRHDAACAAKHRTVPSS